VDFVLVVIGIAAVNELAIANPDGTTIAWRAMASSVSTAASHERCASAGAVAAGETPK
jgi:hypothetical protein